MSEFTEKKPGEKTFQLDGLYCFYSPTRAGNEYDTVAYRYLDKNAGNVEAITVNYYGTMLSDGTPGGEAGDTLVRPDGSNTYVLLGKVVGEYEGVTVLEKVYPARETAAQLSAKAGPASALAKAAKKPPKPKEHLTRDQKQQQKFGRNNFNRQQKARFKMRTR